MCTFFKEYVFLLVADDLQLRGILIHMRNLSIALHRQEQRTVRMNIRLIII